MYTMSANVCFFHLSEIAEARRGVASLRIVEARA